MSNIDGALSLSVAFTNSAVTLQVPKLIISSFCFETLKYHILTKHNLSQVNVSALNITISKAMKSMTKWGKNSKIAWWLTARWRGARSMWVQIDDGFILINFFQSCLPTSVHFRSFMVQISKSLNCQKYLKDLKRP